MKAGIITALLLVGLGVAAQPAMSAATAATAASAASQRPITITLTPKPSASANPKVAKALLVKRLAQLDLTGTVQQSGARLTVTLPQGVGKHSTAEIVPGEVRFRPVLANLRPDAQGGVDAELAAAVQQCDVAKVTAAPAVAVTAAADDLPDVCIVADTPAGVTPAVRSLLGPATLVGSDLKSAKAMVEAGNGNVVVLNLTKAGEQKFNELAGKLYGQQSPTDQAALVADRAVWSNPAFQANSFSGPVQISGGGAKGFTSAETRKLADIVNSGASVLGAYEISHVTPG